MKKLFIILFLAAVQFAQMVPHPTLTERIKAGEIEIPYAMKHKAELKQRGVSTGWTSDELKNLNSLKRKEDIQRVFGPAKPASGTFNTLFVFVEFTDQASQVSLDFFDDLLFADTESSLRGYYNQISYGDLDLITQDMPTTIGWVTAPQPYSYYVDGQNGYGTFPANTQGLARDVVQLIDPLIDLSKYDNDGDGEIDALFIVFTGSGAEFTGSDDDIWSHAWSIPGGYVTNDSVTAYRYAVQPEYYQTVGDMTIGVYAHEMAHAIFGLPDLYDYDNSSLGTGKWSLMSVGNWNGFSSVGGDTPAWPDAWSLVQMGYATAVDVKTNLIGETINATTNEPDIYKLWKDGFSSSEYFLVQNRQKLGYDQALPGAGLLVWHIDETQTSNDNEWYPAYSDSGHYKVALEQADGNYDLEKFTSAGDDGDPFPGSTNNTFFDDSSAPNSKAYDGTSTNVTIENISSPSASMTADLIVSEVLGSINLTYPNGGETWYTNSTQTIQWTSSDVANVSIDLSTDGGANWWIVSQSTSASSGQYTWTVPSITSTNCLIRVLDVSDSSVTDQSDFPFTISNATSLTVASPNGGEEWYVNSTQSIEWTSTGINNVGIELSTNGGSGWTLVAANIPASAGQYFWTVPNIPSTDCLIKIFDVTNNSTVDQSDSLFTINAIPEINVESPNGGELYAASDTVALVWSSTNVANVKLEYSLNNGVVWSTIESSTLSTGSYFWETPAQSSTQCLIKISNAADNSIFDVSDSVFILLPTNLSAPQLKSPQNDSMDVKTPIIFEWQVVQGAAEYNFQLATENSFTDIILERKGLTSNSLTLGSFVDGMKYYWRVLAKNSVSDSPYSDVYSFVTKLSSPSELKASIGSNPNPVRIDLTWIDNSNGETGYFIERRDVDWNWMLHDRVDANVTTWWETVNNPANYAYRVKAESDYTESDYSNVASAVVSGIFDDIIPTEYSLAQNYPNPFNPSTQIRFGLPFESMVKLKVFNMLGQTIAELKNEVMNSGYHILRWNTEGIASGIYFYSIEANSVVGNKSFVSIKKMILLR